jgi:uncharacterized membrane protein YadS
MLSMGDAQFGFFCGAAINDTSSVVAAAYSYSDAAGITATVVKLTRTLFIIPIAFIIAFARKKSEEVTGDVHPAKVFPWFIVAFLVVVVINSLNLISVEISDFWGSMGKFCIMIAMAAIGLSTDPRGLVRYGNKPVLLGGCCSIAVASVSFAVLNVLNPA